MKLLQVILLQPVEGLGEEGSTVEVACGYARNFLFPKGLAVPATPANRRRLEAIRIAQQRRKAREYEQLMSLAEQLSKIELIVVAKAGEKGRLFGAVTGEDIHQKLLTVYNINLDRHNLQIEEPIKSVGDYEINVKLPAGIRTTLRVKVLPEAKSSHL